MVSGRPAFLSVFLKRRTIFRGLNGVPFEVQKTNWESISRFAGDRRGRGAVLHIRREHPRLPECAHAIPVAIDEALKYKGTGEKKVIAFNLSGHDHFDTRHLR